MGFTRTDIIRTRSIHLKIPVTENTVWFAIATAIRQRSSIKPSKCNTQNANP